MHRLRSEVYELLMAETQEISKPTVQAECHLKAKPHGRGKLGMVEKQTESQCDRLAVMVAVGYRQWWELMQGSCARTCSFDTEFVFSFDGKSLEVLKRAPNRSFEKVLWFLCGE